MEMTGRSKQQRVCDGGSQTVKLRNAIEIGALVDLLDLVICFPALPTILSNMLYRHSDCSIGSPRLINLMEGANAWLLSSLLVSVSVSVSARGHVNVDALALDF